MRLLTVSCVVVVCEIISVLNLFTFFFFFELNYTASYVQVFLCVCNNLGPNKPVMAGLYCWHVILRF